jgi:diguanylate cyclase (GGDEF)-like protein
MEMGMGSSGDRHWAASNTKLLLDHVVQRAGDEGRARMLALAGEERSLEELYDEASWTSHDQFVALVAAAAEVLGGEEALTHIYAESGMVTVSGSTADLVALVHALGSPTELVRNMDASNHFGSMELKNFPTGEASYVSNFRARPGFAVSRDVCAFMRGVIPLGVRVFGFSDITVEEVACQARGDEWCTVHVSWDATRDLDFQIEEANVLRQVAEKRLEGFQQTIADIVSADDLDAVLERIINAAARATSSNVHVLEIDGLGGRPRHYTIGATTQEARDIAGHVDEGLEGYLSVDVASSTRRYGRLIMADLGGAKFELPALEGYARLASTALDSAVALEDSRREARMSAALLELATSLARLSTSADVAATMVHAMPEVLDCDSCAVMFRSEGSLYLAAQHGFRVDASHVLLDMPLEQIEVELRGIIVRLTSDMTDVSRASAESQGLVATATAPILVEGKLAGVLVAGVNHGPERLTDNLQLHERFTGLAAQAAIALNNAWLVDQIRHQSLHDSLTDLPNRSLILDRTEQMLVRSARHRRPCAALFIDLDGFKEVNDTLGHEAGDHLLRAVADRLRAAVRDSDTVGRLGGDEFVVLADGASLNAGVEVVAERLLDVLREPFELPHADHPMPVRASIGIALGESHTASELLRDADIALYSAKDAGKGCYRIFAPEMQLAAKARAEVLEALCSALGRDEFFLEYQPIFDLSAERATGVEALLRWNHPDEGVLQPADFVPQLEESGLIVDVGRWVLQEACRQTAAWHAEGHRIDVSVNASIRQLERHTFVAEVREALLESGLDPASLIVEITETAIMIDADTTISVLRELKALGVRIAIDDFGTGYSSLAYLRQFPVDALKIDRSFIAGLADTPAASELIRTLVRLGKALDLETYAEGIEHRDQLEHLQDEGCDSGQGYMFARPLSSGDVTAFLSEHNVDQTLRR